jgi:hypothetical protein
VSRQLRAVLTDLGLSDGDRMRLTVLGPGELALAKVPNQTQPEGPYRTLIDGAGLYTADGSPVAHADLVDALAYAVGRGPGTPLPALADRLRDRRNTALLSALTLLFPEELTD